MTNKLPRLDRSIVLVGLMGAGKSTMGKRLARRLGMDFVDSDDEIEVAARHKISEIFDRFGEAGFRDGERRVIARLVGGAPRVVATGGGAFLNEQTRALLLEHCIVIWLDADVETLARRVARSDHRPLLRGKDAAAVLRELAIARNPYYAEAHLHIKSHSLPQEQTVDRIVEALAGWRGTS
ncbi:shikimate kinase [Sphingosinicella rhizophila]|uniref:Shikimate kinase n=1 Tax=Sphingosinicella rhizophila TaxID=3050082 RepID=A0ABU3Q364_9SPHN|nr:shikimate kinase [Sphingosinicella sp. GR2756]MDT9597858.1 shikimate kinase [Sphingosinicella sp. GR2756]